MYSELIFQVSAFTIAIEKTGRMPEFHSDLSPIVLPDPLVVDSLASLHLVLVSRIISLIPGLAVYYDKSNQLPCLGV